MGELRFYFRWIAYKFGSDLVFFLYMFSDVNLTKATILGVILEEVFLFENVLVS